MSWDDYFMAIAFLSARRSKDPNRQVQDLSKLLPIPLTSFSLQTVLIMQVGACIVSQDRVILGTRFTTIVVSEHSSFDCREF